MKQKIISHISYLLGKNSELGKTFKDKIEFQKRREELDFWLDRFSKNGGVKYWRDLYFQLYCHFLCIDKDYFKNKILMDIGCGPHGVLDYFDAKFKIGIDPLVDFYKKELGLSNSISNKYIACGGEDIPLPDESVDAIMSRNALDHVDNVEGTFKEIHRLLKKDGEVVFAINYQYEPTVCEPHVLTDETIDNLLKNLFNYKIIKKYPAYYDAKIGDKNQFVYPHEIVTITGTKK